MITLSSRTNRPEQKVQIQIRLLQGAVWSGSTLSAFPPAFPPAYFEYVHDLWKNRFVQIIQCCYLSSMGIYCNSEWSFM